MARSPKRLTTIVLVLFMLIIIGGAVAVPTAYFTISYQYMKGNLVAEAEINAQSIEQVIGANPEMWEYEESRLEEYLARRPKSGMPEIRRVYDRDNKLVMESSEKLPPPALKASFDLYDYGRLAGKIEIARSLQPLLVRTSFLAVLLLSGGGLLIILAMKYPLRIMGEAEERIHDALRKAEEERAKSDSVIAAIGDGICIVDRDYKVLYQNNMHADLMGRRTGGHCYEAYRQGRGACEKCPLERVFTEGGTYTLVNVLEREGGQVILENKISPLMDEEENIISAIELIRDITERNKLEERLSQTQKMESVGQLAGGVAHDFNNILTAIIGYANLTLMKMADDEELRSNIEQIISASEKAAGLTGSLLAFSRKQIINQKNQDLNSIVRTMEKLLRRVIDEDIELETDLADEELTVNVDQIQIQQVLLNLATNARDAMPKGGQLLIRSGKIIFDRDFIRNNGYGEAGIYAQVSVTDTGHGIDSDVMENIFDPFYTTKQTGKGTGLGLSIVYGVVKQHDGFVNVYSDKDHGTSFTIYLPLVTGAGDAGDIIPQKESMDLSGGSETVLLAEDDSVLRELTGKILEEFGYHVIRALDGEDAVRKFREHKDTIELAIIDVVMPRMNGKEAFEEIRKITPGLKVLFMSGYAADIIQVKDVLNDNLSFLYKPIAPRELLKRVRTVLGPGVAS